MVPTDELRTKLRQLLNESIPAGKTDGDTRFSNTEIDGLLTEADNVYLAASEGWILKAAKIQEQLGLLSEVQAGDERTVRVGLTDASRFCYSQSEVFRNKGQDLAKGGSRVLVIREPHHHRGDPR